jgi:pilus assembly protein CpaB
MKPKTMILMVVAVACGLGAAALTANILGQQRTAAPEEEVVKVVMAKVKVNAYQQIKDKDLNTMFEVKDMPVTHAPPRAIRDLVELKDQRLNSPASPQTIITKDQVQDKNQGGLEFRLEKGLIATSIKVDPESITGGHVLPGSRVDIMQTTKTGDIYSRLVLQYVLVAAVDQQDERNPDERSKVTAQTVTFAVKREEALALGTAQQTGTLKLLIRSPADKDIVDTPIVRFEDLSRPLSSRDENATEAESVAETPGLVRVPTVAPPEEPVKTEPVVESKPATSGPKINPPPEEFGKETTPVTKPVETEPKKVVKEQPKPVHVTTLIEGGQKKRVAQQTRNKENSENDLKDPESIEEKKK